MDPVASPKVSHTEVQGEAWAGAFSDSNSEAQETPVVGTTSEKAATSRNTRDMHASPTPTDLRVKSDAVGHTEGTAHVANPKGDVTAVGGNALVSVGTKRPISKKRRRARSMSKISATSSTSAEHPKADAVKKPSLQSQSSSSTAPVNERRPEDGNLPPTKAAEAPTEYKTKRVHSGHKSKMKKRTGSHARTSQVANTLNPAEEPNLAVPHIKDSPSPALTGPVKLAPIQDPSPLENSQTGVAVATKTSAESPGRLTNDGPSRVTATTPRDSQIPAGTRASLENPPLNSVTSGNQGPKVAAATPDDAGQSHNVMREVSPETREVHVTEAPDEKKDVFVEAKQQVASRKKTGDSTSCGESSVTHREDAGPRSGAPSTMIMWSYCPLNVSFTTNGNSRDERILSAVVFLVSAVMFLLLITAVMLLFYAKRARSPLACVTAECLAARDYLTRLLNTSKDACNDFYGYVCDSWLERRKDGGGSFRRDSIAAWLARVNESLLRDVGWEAQRHFQPSSGAVPSSVKRRAKVESRSVCEYGGESSTGSAGVQVMRHVYGNCHYYVSSKSAPLPFEKTLESARKQLKWNQVRGSHSYKELVSHLTKAAILSGCQTIMTVEVFSEHDQLVLRLSRGYSLLRKLTTTGRRHDLEKALDRVLGKDLEKIVDVDLAVDADLGGNHSAEWREEPEMTKSLREILEGLLPDVPVADWIQIFDDVLHSSGKRVYSTRAAYVTGAQSLRKAFRNLADNNSIAVTALYVASHLDAEVLQLEMSRERVSSDETMAASFCLVLAQKSLAHSWPKLIANVMDVRESVSVLKAMDENIRKMSHDLDVLFTWLPKTVRSVMGKKIDLMTLVVVSENDRPDHLDPNVDYEDEDYAPLLAYIETQSVEFVDLYLRAMAYTHESRPVHLPRCGRCTYRASKATTS
ncbi:hypothetical protein HPB51_018978 [Rhipicephalus microplus]|uniref:Uncharacterized protein n=1 Tax=Rhipicephalus microplus TaxID=6941 RepID=A0A9J6EB63_RHIMP|nr:hypothetical protein HPB51_018978 [Rhipicephalus microplus]